MVEDRRKPVARAAWLASAAGLLSFAFLIGGLLSVKAARILELDRHLAELTEREEANRNRLLEAITGLEESRDPAMNSVTDADLLAALGPPEPKKGKASPKTRARAEALARESKLRLLKLQLEKPSELSYQIDALLPSRGSWYRELRLWGVLLLLSLGISSTCLLLSLAPRAPEARPPLGAFLKSLAWYLPAVLLPALAGWVVSAVSSSGGAGPIPIEPRAAAFYDLSKYLQVSGGLGVLFSLFIPARAKKLLGS